MYGKMLYFQRHTLLILHVECYSLHYYFGYVCQMLFLPFLMLTHDKPNLLMLVVTDVIVIMYVTTGVIGRCYCQVVLMADNSCHCDRWYSHFFIIVADGNHMRDN